MRIVTQNEMKELEKLAQTKFNFPEKLIIENVALLAARAILDKDRDLAVRALTVHPLIGSYPLAEKLVAAFLEAHAPLVGTWH